MRIDDSYRHLTCLTPQTAALRSPEVNFDAVEKEAVGFGSQRRVLMAYCRQTIDSPLGEPVVERLFCTRECAWHFFWRT